MRALWQVIAEAWEPFLGAAIAEERARNAAMTVSEETDREETRYALTRSLLFARLPHYGGLKLNGSTIMDAAQAALHAIEEHWS